ncbi:DUF4199 domain-containing protein [Xanthomarina sp. F2636L]|uniref:DUF4199 domain-containing protein n=1 Tax=Xanthomarina sp. F2636L TaxID=2996018 RepID=UPI00225E05A4|nr:DUF4199 domain-containing protein [Xanthomarina sp. F2636L]MCX7550171.1 DUF4199 domain-containing protein [Xanthomarina sp. F2636L]
METSIKSNSINYGLYLGGVLSLFTVFAYAINLDLFTKWWYGISLMVLVIIFGIISAMSSKKLLNGIINFKGAFSSYFITVAVGIVISSLVSFVIFNVIDPEAATLLQEKILDSQVEMMRGFGAPEDAIAEVVEQMEKEDNMFAITKVLQSIAFQLIGFSVVGLIVALVVKKEDPEA